MAKYRQRLILVDAEQFFEDQKPWPDGVVRQDLKGAQHPHKPKFFTLDTIPDQRVVHEGDWIITDRRGNHMCCRDDVFDMLYEPNPDAK